MFYFFFDNCPDGFGVHLLPYILNFYLSRSNFLLFFLLSLSSCFIIFPFTHKSFFMCTFFITNDEDLVLWLVNASWLLGRAVKAWLDGGLGLKFERTESLFLSVCWRLFLLGVGVTVFLFWKANEFLLES